MTVTTADLAAADPSAADLQRPLRLPAVRLIEEGDHAPPIGARDHTGQGIMSNADLVTGKPLVLLFYPVLDDPALEAGLIGFRERAEKFALHDATVFIISRAPVAANAELRSRLALPFQVLEDVSTGIYTGYGVMPNPRAIGAVPRLTLFLLDSAHRVARILDDVPPDLMVDRALEALEALTAAGRTHANRESAGEESGRPIERLKSHPPVLVLPRVLTARECDYLCQIWHRPVKEWRTDGFTNEGFRAETGDFKVVHDGAYGQAIEYIVQDPTLQKFLDSRLRRRLMPEIRKVFQTSGLNREGYRIAGYDAAGGGILHPHRDNSIPTTARRRFTSTVNLNAGAYEGGELRFREYGEQFYTVERGTAIVWSASLLHEVLPVTKGRRLVLGVHMFGGGGGEGNEGKTPPR